MRTEMTPWLVHSCNRRYNDLRKILRSQNRSKVEKVKYYLEKDDVKFL